MNILFSHNDLDGIACNIVAKYFFDDIKIFNCNYGEIDDRIYAELCNSENNNIIISDICYSKNRKDITKLLKRQNSVIIADHHPGSVWTKNIFKTTNVRASGDKCGAILLYEILKYIYENDSAVNANTYKIKLDYYFYKLKIDNNRLYNFLDYVNDWDIWTWIRKSKEHPFSSKSLLLNNAIYLFGVDKFSECVFNYIGSKTDNIFSAEEMDKLIDFNSKQEKEINEYLDNKILAKYHSNEYGDLTCYIIPMNNQYQSLTSYLLNESLKDNNTDFDVLYFLENGSLRNPKPGIDLNIIAKELGGGGHAYAAGFNWNDNKHKFKLV